MKCIDCGRTFLTGDYILYSHRGCYCADRKNCFEKRKTMPNIKITAEVDGKIVPLNTISTESFEAIKALEKPKEIPVPVARVGNYHGCLSDKRLFLKITNSIRNNAADNDIEIIAIELKSGLVQNSWFKDDARCLSDLYENIKPL